MNYSGWEDSTGPLPARHRFWSSSWKKKSASRGSHPATQPRIHLGGQKPQQKSPSEMGADEHLKSWAGFIQLASSTGSWSCGSKASLFFPTVPCPCSPNSSLSSVHYSWHVCAVLASPRVVKTLRRWFASVPSSCIACCLEGCRSNIGSHQELPGQSEWGQGRESKGMHMSPDRNTRTHAIKRG